MVEPHYIVFRVETVTRRNPLGGPFAAAKVMKRNRHSLTVDYVYGGASKRWVLNRNVVASFKGKQAQVEAHRLADRLYAIEQQYLAAQAALVPKYKAQTDALFYPYPVNL